MASDEFRAFIAAMAERPAPDPNESIEETRARIDTTMGALPLADGVTVEEADANGVPALWLQPPEDSGTAVLYLHGGGYRMGSAIAYRSYCSKLAAAWGVPVVPVDYRLAPEHPFPAAFDDAVAAYRWLSDRCDRVVIAGDSAGGGLAAAVALAVDDKPAGVVCISPWADLTNTAETFTTRADVDTMFSLDAATEAASWYLAGGTDPTDPRVSPLFGDWTGMPPLLVHVGDAEVLLDDALGLVERARAAGVDVASRVFPDMPHVFQMHFPAFPEAVETVAGIGEFVRRVGS